MDYYQYKISPYSSSQVRFYYVCFKPIDYAYRIIILKTQYMKFLYKIPGSYSYVDYNDSKKK